MAGRAQLSGCSSTSGQAPAIGLSDKSGCSLKKRNLLCVSRLSAHLLPCSLHQGSTGKSCHLSLQVLTNLSPSAKQLLRLKPSNKIISKTDDVWLLLQRCPSASCIILEEGRGEGQTQDLQSCCLRSGVCHPHCHLPALSWLQATAWG